MVKRVFVLLVSLLAFLPLAAQPVNPVSWTASVSRTGEGSYEILLTGEMPSAWHIYDLADYGPDGPNGTHLSIEGPSSVRPQGAPELRSALTRRYDPLFGMEIGLCSVPVEILQRVACSSDEAVTLDVTIEWQACDDTSCTPPEECTLQVTLSPEEPLAAASAAGKSLWALILEALIWGFVALLTPCVFPMVPMTVSFFLKQNDEEEGRRGQGRWLASVFGLSIVALYTVPIAVIILITYLTGGETVTADIFNWLATHWLPNILFFLIFMTFAASFFGAFEIVLPSRWVNRSDARSQKRGLAGVFFVALTLVLVSFSCTGPIVGSVLIKSTQGQFWEPILTMFAFSVAFALPFTVLAFAPSLLKKLPKSGGWLNSVKVVLGFIEVALGFKFLSVADQTYHWGLLDREVYLAIWIVVFTLLGLYLLGKIRFANDTPPKHLSVLRLALVIIDFSFVVYMIPGMWGAPLKGLSGYLPPITTQDFNLDRSFSVRSDTYYAAPSGNLPAGRKYADVLHLPYDIPAFFDYEEAREWAIKTGKPLFVDFTGHGCVNCREMEARVWSDPRALKLLKEEYVVCALFADDKMRVDPSDWVTTSDGRVLRTLGKINSYFALTRFQVNAQPYYAILDPVSEEHLVPSRGYSLDVASFVKFLEDGLVR